MPRGRHDRCPRCAYISVLRAQADRGRPRGRYSAASQSVGAQVGADLFENAGLALLFALILVFAYVMLRFRWKLAVGAIVATLHDVHRDDRHLRRRWAGSST